MFNSRVVIFAGVMLVLIGWPICTFLDAKFDHRVHYFGSYREVSLKALGDFDLDPHAGSLADVPSRYRTLDGQKVLLEGEIYDPQETGDKTKEFQLVYAIQRGSFHQPRVQERVFCTMPNDKFPHDAESGYYKVLGTLHVIMKREKFDDGRTGVIEVYHLDADSVKPSNQD